MYIWIRNSAGGCISWHEIPSGTEPETFEETLKQKFAAPGFSFEIKNHAPRVPEGGYSADEKTVRRIRFLKNIT